MSEKWRYESKEGVIAEIYCKRSKFPEHMHIFPWIVVFRDGTEVGLYNVNEDDYNGVDKAALEAALENAAALRLKYKEIMIQKVADAESCCTIA